jgi:hypothetical protein
MSDLEKKEKGSGLSVLDTVLVAAAVVGGVLVLLWALRVVAGLIRLAFEVAVLVVVVLVIIRIAHFFTRSDR